eukprot:COSAG02_NODE_50007_length_323_cov_0.901786_1_plen_70_part_10
MATVLKHMSSTSASQIHWWSAIAIEEPDSSDSESEDEVWPDSRPSERESREYRAFCQRMAAGTRQETNVQ